MVMFAIAVGYGLSMLLGVPFTSLQQILPFILIGIGVDDAFVIVAAFDRTDKSKPIEDRMHTAMHRVGMSVTMTSLTDVAAFMLALSAPLTCTATHLTHQPIRSRRGGLHARPFGSSHSHTSHPPANQSPLHSHSCSGLELKSLGLFYYYVV